MELKIHLIQEITLIKSQENQINNLSVINIKFLMLPEVLLDIHLIILRLTQYKHHQKYYKISLVYLQIMK